MIINDVGVTPSFAFSSRRLDSGYDGPLVRIQRNHQNQERDFGEGLDEVETSPIRDYSGPYYDHRTNMWYYDQVGGTLVRHPQDEIEPQFVIGFGKKKRAAQWYNAGDGYATDIPPIVGRTYISQMPQQGTDDLTLVAVASTHIAGSIGGVTPSTGFGAAGQGNVLISRGLDAWYLRASSPNGNWAFKWRTKDFVFGENGPGLHTYVVRVKRAEKRIQIWVDGEERLNEVNVIIDSADDMQTSNLAAIGVTGSGKSWLGEVGEIIQWQEALSDTQIDTVINNIEGYWG